MRDNWTDDNERKIKYFQKLNSAFKEKLLLANEQNQELKQRLKQLELEKHNLIIENQTFKSKAKKILYENKLLNSKIAELENYHQQFYHKYDTTKSEILNVAYHNSNLIIAKAIKIANNFKMRIEGLLYDVEINQTNPILVVKIISEFLKENREIFLINTKNNDKILNEVELLLHEKLIK